MFSKALLLHKGCVGPRLHAVRAACSVVHSSLSATSVLWRHQAASAGIPLPTLVTRVVRHASTEPEDPTHRVWTVPNVLTGIRLLASPFLSYLIMTSQLQAAVGVFFAAGVLDYLDGAIARAWDQKTKLGGFLDPVADKALVACAAIPIIMTHPEVLHPAVVAIVVGRDACLLIGGLYIRGTTKPKDEAFFSISGVNFEVAPTMVSKVNTTLQIGLLTSALTHLAFQWPPLVAVDVLSCMVVATTAWSGLDYWRSNGFKAMEKAKSAWEAAKQRTKATVASGTGVGAGAATGVDSTSATRGEERAGEERGGADRTSPGTPPSKKQTPNEPLR